MHSWVHQNPQDLYLHQLKALQEGGERVEVKGRPTVELINCSTHLETPWNPCILIPARRWNPWLAMSEGLWIIAGRNDVAALRPYNRQIESYSDNGKTLYGAYGKRMYTQIDTLVSRLKADPTDRRAVLQIWNQLGHTNEGWIDLYTDSKDPPCNDMVMFKLRGERLHMTVINRSNDIHWGLYAVNLPSFQMLQQYIAARLEVGIGTQTHVSNSLHYYEDAAANAITERMLDKTVRVRPAKYPVHELMFKELTDVSHSQMASYCNMVLDNVRLSLDTMPFLAFAREFLRMYREHDWKPDLLPFAEQYQDWVKAGDIFVKEVWNGRS